MKAPNIIFVDDLAVVNDCVTKISLEQLPNFSEYLRKDALLEWAKSQLEVYDAHLKGQYDAAWWHEKHGIQKVIDKLNSL